eukprot:CAMPEP_0198676458 /NCGR_PEP_ID=MMETSP1467-20131203/98925_1 /TAXON_ID=1462469 /ORGANISM="unid. sp., Strain CCMP2135" /LENGTH=46 /DNA_ID= /DNA_START= /DNA_END= /DNA_ORIENTATION=
MLTEEDQNTMENNGSKNNENTDVGTGSVSSNNNEEHRQSSSGATGP